MDLRNNPSSAASEMTEETAKLFCEAKRDDQALVIAFQSGLKVGKVIATSPEKR